MQTTFRLDLNAIEQRVIVIVTAGAAFAPEFAATLDAAFTHVATLVDAQGFSEHEDDAALVVTATSPAANSNARSYELQCHRLHPGVWRVLVGLLHTFDMASMPLDAVRLEGSGRVVPDAVILGLAYPGARADHGLPLQREAGAGMGRSVEIELAEGATTESRQIIQSGLVAWLDLCEGGFFLDGEHPVTSAHDCPGLAEVGANLLVARFEYFSGSESAFDVLVNALGHWHRQWAFIVSVRIY